MHFKQARSDPQSRDREEDPDVPLEPPDKERNSGDCRKERGEALKDDPAAKTILEEGRKLAEKLTGLEEKLHNPRAEVAYDILAQKGGARLYSRLLSLYSSALDSDGPPTQGMREVFAEQAAELKRFEQAWNALLSEDLALLNQKAADLKLPHIIAPAKEPGR